MLVSIAGGADGRLLEPLSAELRVHLVRGRHHPVLEPAGRRQLAHPEAEHVRCGDSDNNNCLRVSDCISHTGCPYKGTLKKKCGKFHT